MLSPVQDGPRDAAGVLALQEERLGFAILESEDLAVAADVELTLYTALLASDSGHLVRRRPIATAQVGGPDMDERSVVPSVPVPPRARKSDAYLSRVDSLARECVVVGPHLDCGCRRCSGVWEFRNGSSMLRPRSRIHEILVWA